MLASASLLFWLGILAANTPPDPPQDWLDFLTRGGLLGGALLIIYALLTDRLVSGSRHRREIAARDQEITIWRDAALRATGVSERISSVFFPAAGPREGP